MTIFERYADLVGDERAFREASTNPLPVTAWSNAPLFRPVSSLLGGLGDVLEQIPARPDAYRVPNAAHPSFMAARLLGAMHIQEEAAMLPVDMLRPDGSERILDACAAPGNKTAAIALRLGPRGRVIAVDVSEARMGVLRTTLNTLGIVNVAGVRADASRLQEDLQHDLQNDLQGAPRGGLGLFDAAMVDVPCSCEGTSRKHPDVANCISDNARRSLSDLQERILRSAIRHVRPGGRIVYATCTYSPEENEAVVAAVLERPEEGHDVRVLPGPDHGFSCRPGVTAWRGASYPDALRHAKRLWPHVSDTGGFFAVLLEKTGSEHALAGPANVGHQGATAAVRGEDYPWSAYAIPADATRPLVDIRSGSKYSSLVSEALASDPVMNLSGYCPDRLLFTGMRGMNLKSGRARPSTAAAIRFGAGAKAGIIEIRAEDALPFLRRESVPVVHFVPPCEPIPVAIVRSAGCSVGLGRIDASEPHLVRSLFPKVRAGIDVAESLIP